MYFKKHFSVAVFSLIHILVTVGCQPEKLD